MIRRAKKEDIKSVYKIYSDDTHDGHDFEPITYSIKDFYEYCPDKRTLLLVYEEKGAVMGFVLAYDLLKWCYLDILCVSKKFRNKGIGLKLINKIFALKPKFDSIEMCYYSDDTVMQKYLEKNNFKFNDKKTTWVSMNKKNY